jgi:hypothetical protein
MNVMLVAVTSPLGSTEPIEVRAATICVSGFANIVAQSLFRDGKRLCVVQSGTAVPLFQTTAPSSSISSPPELWKRSAVWCGSCKKMVPEETTRDSRLGFSSYCSPCVRELVARCLEANGRLPSAGSGQWFCRTCSRIRDVSEQSPLDHDGRRRWAACRRCRLDQTYRARRERRQRLEADAAAA